MKNLMIALSFSTLFAFTPALQAAVNPGKSVIYERKDDDKKKKKKNCDSATKEECAKGKKACCKKKEAAPAQ